MKISSSPEMCELLARQSVSQKNKKLYTDSAKAINNIDRKW